MRNQNYKFRLGGYASGVYFFILFSLSYISSTGQPIPPQPPVINIPTSPEAAMLGRFGDIPVGYYTGTAGINIPLYTVRLGNIDIPVTLRYHSSGIKVADQATWVGLGWDLSPEGSIIQEVRGKSDEYDIGMDCSENYAHFKQRFAPLQSGLADPYMFQIQWGRVTAPNQCGNGVLPVEYPPAPLPSNYYDTHCIIDKLTRGYHQPDIYHYNFGGYSGKFYKNPETGQIILIDRNKQIYFEILNTSTIKATTLDGAAWIFDVLETAGGGTEYEYTGKTYKLGKVTLLTGREVSFAYTANTYHERVLQQQAEITIFSGQPLHENYTLTIHSKKTLKSITSADVKIIFNTDARQDINIGTEDNLEKLSSVDIIARVNNKKIRSFQFNYSYFPYNTVGVPVYDAFISTYADALGKRLRLNSVQEIGYTDNGQPDMNKPPYRFEYETSITMPMKISLAKDFWGYYNGQHNTTLLPNLDYFDYFNQPEYKASNLIQSYPYTGANRYTNNETAGAYMLKKITYPTGGYSEFQYEPNSFENQFIPDQSSPILKNYEVQDHSLGGTTSTLFKLSKATTIRFENRINNGAGNPNNILPLTYAQMQDCYIRLSKVKMINGSPEVTVIKQWDLSTVLNAEFQANGGKSWSEQLRIEYDPDPNPTFNYLIQVLFPDHLNNPLFHTIAGVTSRLTFYDDTGVDTTVSKQCGLRVKSIRNYTASDSISSNRLIRYYHGKLLNKFRPLSVYKANHLEISGVSNGTGFEYISFYNKITVSGTNFGVDGGNPIGYGKVEEIELSGENEGHGKKVFTYLNEENKTGQDRPVTPDLKNGFIAREEIFDAGQNKVQEKSYTYTRSSIQPAVMNYVCINTVRLSTGSKVPCGNIYQINDPFITKYYAAEHFIGSEYGFNAYTIHSEWYQLESAVTKQYFNVGSVLTTQELYAYNDEGNTRYIKTIDSKNDSLITRYYYPNDYQVNPYTDGYLTLVHNTGSPVITERYRNGLLLERERVLYHSFPGVGTLLPKFTMYSNKNNPEEVKMTIDSYDFQGNITQYTAQDGIPVSVIWNEDGTLPVAKIENATYAGLLALPNGLNSNFRTELPNARVTTYTYKPLIGVATITDSNNKPSYYEYDSYGRLLIIKDQDGNIIRTFQYHYKQ